MNIEGEMTYCVGLLIFDNCIWSLIESCNMSNTDKTIFGIEAIQYEESSANLKMAL